MSLIPSHTVNEKILEKILGKRVMTTIRGMIDSLAKI